MSYDYDPPEPTEEELEAHETEKAAANSPKVSITGLTRDDIEAVIRGVVENAFGNVRSYARELLPSELTQYMQTAVSEAVTSIGQEMIAEEVRRSLDEGFKETDQWGNLKAHHTLKARINKVLTETGGYNDSRTYVQRVVEEYVKRAVEKEMKDELAAVREQFRKQVDEVLNAKLAEALRQSLGLK